MEDYQRVHLNFLMAKRSLDHLWIPYIKDDVTITRELNFINQTSINLLKSQTYYFSSIESQMKNLEKVFVEKEMKKDKVNNKNNVQSKKTKEPLKNIPIKQKVKFVQYKDLNVKEKEKDEFKLKEVSLDIKKDFVKSHIPKTFFKIDNNEANAINDKDPINIKNLISKRPNDLKFRSDCFRKRIKTHFHNYVYKHISNLINDKTKVIYRLPREFNTNIRFDFNNMILKFTIRELFSYVPQDEYDKINAKKTIDIINSITDAKLMYFLNRTYFDVFIEYIHSSSIKEELTVIVKNDGQEYIKYFKYFLENYLPFYSASSKQEIE